MANILIVHAHREPRSFSSALARTAAETFAEQGHEVVFSDLHALGFDPVSDRRNFLTTADAAYLKQQNEEAHASVNAGFAAELDAEMKKVEACDLMVFSFPLWWFGMPAILKGWVDRVFAYGHLYGRGRWYKNGSGKGKRAIVVMTTGGGAAMYGGTGMHPSLDAILTPVHHGIFWFNGFSPLPPFVAWSAAHGSDADRHAMLDELRERLQNVFEEDPGNSRSLDPETFADSHSHFMVTLRRNYPANKRHLGLIPSRLEKLHKRAAPERADHRKGFPDWRAYLVFRERGAEAVAAASKCWRRMTGTISKSCSSAAELDPPN